MIITNITSGYKNEYIKCLMFKENHLLFNENFDLCKKNQIYIRNSRAIPIFLKLVMAF